MTVCGLWIILYVVNEFYSLDQGSERVEELRLAEARKKAHMSVSELSRKSGVTRQTIIALESNRKGTTTLKTLNALASALNVNVTDLFC